jgi:hypothetical protein
MSVRHIYPLLVTSDNDVPGALAYFVYKRSKIEWRANFSTTNGRDPTPAEERDFVAFAALPQSLSMYRQQGESLSAEFAKELLEDKMVELATEIVQSELSNRFLTLESQVSSSLNRIETRFDERKSIGGWMRDIGTNLISGIGLILLFGVAAIGLDKYSKFNTGVENSVKPSSVAPAANTIDQPSRVKS